MHPLDKTTQSKLGFYLQYSLFCFLLAEKADFNGSLLLAGQQTAKQVSA